MSEPTPLFSSARERRLWAWTLAVVIAIYSTLGLARTLAGELGDRGLLDQVFFISFLVIVAVIVTQGLRTRPGVAEIAVALGVAAVYVMVFLRMAIPEERTHLVEYGVVAICVLEALEERTRNGCRVPKPALLAILATSVVGALDECIQSFLPSRVFDPVDILVNCLAAVMAVVASTALGWARRLTSRSPTA